MSSATNVITIPPRSRHGNGRNYKWSIIYDRVKRTFHWEVRFTIESVVSGEAATEKDAMSAVEQHVRNVRR